MFKRFLVPIDGSDCSQHAAREAVALAAELGAVVTFLYVAEDPYAYLPPDMPSYADLRDDLRRAGEEILAEARQKAESRGVTARVELVAGALVHPVQAILDAEGDHDLIVMGTHGRRGLDRMFVGSVTEGVLRRSSKPHLVIRCPDRSQKGSADGTEAGADDPAREGSAGGTIG